MTFVGLKNQIRGPLNGAWTDSQEVKLVKGMHDLITDEFADSIEELLAIGVLKMGPSIYVYERHCMRVNL